jgi:hypothetical protein
MTNSMTADRSVLDRISIASPCSADWNQMVGDDRKRFCAQCKLHVHDLGAMTTAEALELLRAAGQGRVCARFHRRADGKVMTRDCPVGLRQRMRRAWSCVAAAFAAVLSFAGCRGSSPTANGEPGNTPTTTPEPRRMGEVEMGDVAVPPRPEVKMGLVAPTPENEPAPTSPKAPTNGDK